MAPRPASAVLLPPRQRQKEVDLLIIQDGTVHPLEIKKTASPRKEAVRHFQVLEKLGLPVGLGGVLCLAREDLPLTDKAWLVPVGVV